MSRMTPTPPRRRRRRRLPRAVLAFAAAILLHAAGFGAAIALASAGLILAPRPPSPTRSLQAVGVRTVSAEEWAKNRGAEGEDDAAAARRDAAARREEPEPKKEKPELLPTVRVQPGNGEEDPDAKYAAETSNRAEKQTKARDTTAFYRNAMPKRSGPQRGSAGGDGPEATGNGGQGDDDRPVAEGRQKLQVEIPDLKQRDEVRLGRVPGADGPAVANRTESAEIRGNSSRLRLQAGELGAGEDGSRGRPGKSGIASLVPSVEVLDSIGGAAPNDHLPDVEEGDGTFLSTREWRYASYFNRFKQSVGFHWNPMVEIQRRDPTLRMYGSSDRHTVLQVTLDADGRLKDLFVLKSSGLDFLDLVALKAVQNAQPFPNTPKGILSADGTLTFPFGFYVELSGAGGFHMFRSREYAPR